MHNTYIVILLIDLELQSIIFKYMFQFISVIQLISLCMKIQIIVIIIKATCSRVCTKVINTSVFYFISNISVIYSQYEMVIPAMSI